MTQERQWKPAEETELAEKDEGLFLIHGENTAELYTEEADLEDYEETVYVVILNYNGVQAHGEKVLQSSMNEGEIEQLMDGIASNDIKNWNDIKERYGEEQ